MTERPGDYDEFDSGAIIEQENPYPCPVCEGDADYCREHHLATFAVTHMEMEIRGGALFDKKKEVYSLVIKALSNEAANAGNHPFGERFQKIHDYMTSETLTSKQALYENLNVIINAIREYFTEHPHLDYPRYYEVEEATGLWGYEDYWAEDPESVVDELVRKLSEAAG